MIIPNKVKVGGLEFEVLEDVNVNNEGQVFGSTHFRKQKIFIEPDEKQQKKEQTFFHEVLHAVWWQAGLHSRYKEQKNLEEEIVEALANGMYQVLKDNDLLK
jgi:predicted SprT family Zn-dependent metalloprotease